MDRKTDLRQPRRIAYFSMEVGLRVEMPTYSGGLGVLAGDTLRAAADLGLPLVGVTLLHRQGYFHQHIDAAGEQTEEPSEWRPEDFMTPLPERAVVQISGRQVRVRAWRYDVEGVTGGRIPVYFLDVDLPENAAQDRHLTDRLYQGGDDLRLRQEVVLGVGGVAMLEALGHDDVDCYHMNEGHSSLLTLALLDRQLAAALEVAPHLEEADDATFAAAADAVRRRCVFTTHTPVPAGHDVFPLKLARGIVPARLLELLDRLGAAEDGELNMTDLGLALSRYVNGVAMRHGQVSREMFPGVGVAAITNGVHAATWTSAPFRRLFDRHMPGWQADNAYIRYAVGIPLPEIREAHAAAKRAMVDEVQRRTGVALDADALTLGFARRATAYKRADLLFSDLDRLRAIVERTGPLQVVYGGKAHPRDEKGKALIRRIVQTARELDGAVRVVYLEEYDMHLGHLLTSGVDVWLNTPRKPQEASGTSGMKAALNGVPSFSVLDGWWIEGHVEGVTGWAVDGDWTVRSDDAAEADALYRTLGDAIAPLYYGDPAGFDRVRRQAIALNGSFFNAQRMMVQYVENAYSAPADAAPVEETPIGAAAG